MQVIDAKGLRRSGLMRWLSAPFAMMKALLQAMSILRRVQPQLVIGMGGFVSGPGGLGARLMGIPLLIHEQNAIPGLANRLLAPLSRYVLQAFPHVFAASEKVMTVGNPVRRNIADLAKTQHSTPHQPVHLLVVGGSLGAQALNEELPAAIAASGIELAVRHQAGRGKLEATKAAYQEAGVEAQVTEFIDDMAAAYVWADLVVCRAGALTVSELAAAGLPSVLVPYPYAVDDHQTQNAGFLATPGAAVILQQRDITTQSLAELLQQLCADPQRLAEMANRAAALGQPEADRRIADICEEVLDS
jgi:UDP-N-acetylglucosamine--N-acetylmuramyl-(pentapeptide) pyrophosphoryl-undecaprenol N-acetylglucosamine transferase